MENDEPDPEKIIKDAFNRVEKLTHSRFDNLMEQLKTQSDHIQQLYEIVQIHESTIDELVKTIKYVATGLDDTNKELIALEVFLAQKYPELKAMLFTDKPKKTKKKPARKKKTT